MFTSAFHFVKSSKTLILTPIVGDKNLPIATLIEPAVGFWRGGKLHGDVPLQAEIG